MRVLPFSIRMLPVLGSFGLLVLAGCGNGNDAETESTATAADSLDPEGMGAASRTDALKEIFHAAPSPMEIADMVKRAGATFDAKALNPTSNATKYTTSDRQAINLGVYGADLSYATMFEQNAASLEYLAAVKQLSNALGISDVLTDEVMAQANANRTDRDALIDLVSSSFYDVNERLKENGTEDLAGLVVAAGWVEGMYLATRTMKKAPADLKARIAEQKIVLDDVLRLCKSYEATPELTALLASMKPSEDAFAKVTETDGSPEATQSEDGAFVIGGGPTYAADDATLAAIASAVAQVRATLIK